MAKKGTHASHLKVPKGLDAAITHVLRLEYADSVQSALNEGVELPTHRDISQDLRVTIDWNQDLRDFDVTVHFPDHPDAIPVNDFIHGKLLTGISNPKFDVEFETDYSEGLSATFSVHNLEDFTKAVNSVCKPDNQVRYFDLKRGK